MREEIRLFRIQDVLLGRLRVAKAATVTGSLGELEGAVAAGEARIGRQKFAFMLASDSVCCLARDDYLVSHRPGAIHAVIPFPLCHLDLEPATCRVEPLSATLTP